MKVRLRTKFIVSLVLVVLISGVVSMIIGVRLIGDGIIKQAQDKVRLDINSAREVYNEVSSDIKDVVRLTAVRFFMKNALVNSDLALLQKELERIKENERFDILTLVDAQGIVLVRTCNPTVYGDTIHDDIVSQAIRDKIPVVSTQIVPEEKLFRECPKLAAQARIEIIPTPKARPRDETVETSGMVIMAAAPVFSDNGKLLGILYGGRLLNQSNEIVDRIKDLVYHGEQYHGKDIGTATIFQGDLRISTNVHRKDGTRAIGTRVSQEVYDRVVVQGLPWIARAFVVNGWYITAYEPIKNIDGKIIGILYVGILEQKFNDLQNNVIFTFLAITILGIAFAFAVSFFLANSIVKPVSKLVKVAKHIADGQFSDDVQIESNDEIGDLVDVFNFMNQSIKERDTKIKEFAQKKIAEAERLAMIGQLAAGVAHEINNPLTGIILYCDLLLKGMPGDDKKRKNVERISHEAARCKKIVRGLLEFSRQKKPEIKDSLVNDIISTTLSLVKNQALFHNIDIERNLDDHLPMIKIDPMQIQQVFMNIIINAAESMGGQGVLQITSRISHDGKYIEIQFTDTGSGIDPKHLSKVFEPFFTTKDTSHGVGLGLAISYRIIKDHDGTIAVTSELNQGTTFTIRLPVVPIGNNQ
jgi:two-component system NtrC family sensor kinase